jgi:CRP/FNR family transcriptional regulator
LKKQGRLYKLPKRQILQSTEDRQVINLLASGYVKRYLISNDGTKGIQVLYGPGDIFPITLAHKVLLNQAIYEGPEIYFYESMTDIEIYTLNDKALLEAVRRQPGLYRDLMLEAGNRLNSTLQGLENLTLRSSYKRTAHQIWYLADRFGKRQLGGTRIDIPVTHQDLAEILSITRETVTNSMKKLRVKGLIKTGASLVVPDLKKLEEEAFG